ncbi:MULTISPECIES: hypothetical protein [Mesorhizobium]|uniref:hypothetical protein n=1 Tax=Mesorhizobium TaxID=68287 RepID=UPI0003A18F94|nr:MULTISPECIES: hypothetical protein [Mesorhizobium]
MEKAKLSELKKLRHFNIETLNGRVINIMPLLGEPILAPLDSEPRWHADGDASG